MCGCLLHAPYWGGGTTQACALAGNRTGDPLVHRPAFNPLSHTIRDRVPDFLMSVLRRSVCIRSG